MRAHAILRYIAFFFPTLLAIVYFGFMATGRYVSEAQFVIGTAAKPAGGSGISALLEMTGLARAQDDVFAVQSYLTSRDAIKALGQKLPIRDFYGRPEADIIARYPSLIFGPSMEQFHRYLQWMIDTNYNGMTGITTLRVQAFRPDDAKSIADELLVLGEQLVNRMNQRIRDDSLKLARNETKRCEERLIKAEIAITNFRNRELLIDPAASAVVVTELIARLKSELTQTRAQIGELSAQAPSSPALAGLRGRASALEQQIRDQHADISNPSTGLAEKLAIYERLVLEREFAKSALAASQKSLESAQLEARRQQLFLQRVVDAGRPDFTTVPERLRMIASAAGLNLLLLLVLWLVLSGIGEHAAQRN